MFGWMSMTYQLRTSTMKEKARDYVAAQAALPWREIGWLGHGHTIPCEAAPGYAAVLLLNPALCPVDRGPVSYTPLDVYKRQRSPIWWDLRNCRPQTGDKMENERADGDRI